MDNLLKIFKIDVTNQKSMFLDVEADKVFEQLNYSFYDTPTRNIGNRKYVIICDDNGLRHNEPISACTFCDSDSDKPLEHIRGSILIVRSSDDAFISLDKQDKNNIFDNLYCYTDVNVVRPVIRLNLGY